MNDAQLTELIRLWHETLRSQSDKEKAESQDDRVQKKFMDYLYSMRVEK